VGNVSVNVYAKFHCALLCINKAFKELITTTTTITTRVAFWDQPSKSKKLTKPDQLSSHLTSLTSYMTTTAACTLQSADILLLSTLGVALALLAKDFSVNTPPIQNSLLYSCRSAELLSTFRHILKTDLFLPNVKLPDTAYTEHEHSLILSTMHL